MFAERSGQLQEMKHQSLSQRLLWTARNYAFNFLWKEEEKQRINYFELNKGKG
jgi:hypothetical protein